MVQILVVLIHGCARPHCYCLVREEEARAEIDGRRLRNGLSPQPPDNAGGSQVFGANSVGSAIAAGGMLCDTGSASTRAETDALRLARGAPPRRARMRAAHRGRVVRAVGRRRTRRTARRVRSHRRIFTPTRKRTIGFQFLPVLSLLSEFIGPGDHFLLIHFPSVQW